ncbi:hypothetical protein [Streptomyces sp. NPDC058434]|uniref:hypothetical protein n=1 Tax=Streptomyces sp. NPDC058434 TaxID=3346498 RepID=UPI0036691C61
MGQFEVIVTRTETIRFTLAAASAQDAEARYLLDGSETDSRTSALHVEHVARTESSE